MRIEDERLEKLVLWMELKEFYNEESRLLDNNELEKWFDLLAEDVTYQVPIRMTTQDTDNQFSDKSYHFKETYESIKTRINRFDSEFAWSERPPSRTTRFVGNLQIKDYTSDTIQVVNNVVVFYGQGDNTDIKPVVGIRKDTLRRADKELLLSDREVLLSHSVLNVDKISTFL